MTYRELLKRLEGLTEEQLNDTVTVFEPYDQEYTAIIDTDATVVDDVLHEDHVFLIMKA